MSTKNILDLEKQEFINRDKELCLIPSVGFPPENVLEAQGSIMAVQYAEGRKHARYYAGCKTIDEMVEACENMALQLFDAQDEYNACVEFHSGTSANMAIYGALLNQGDTVLSMSTDMGGHISHGHPLSFLGKYHNVVQYGLTDDGYIDYQQVEDLAIKHKPKLIICGCSAYSRIVDFKRFKEIADKVGAKLMADIAHITSLVITGEHPSPVGLADVISFTTHKMLNSARGGVVLYKKELEKAITRGLIPFSSGGPLENMVYAKLVGFNNIIANYNKFVQYTKQVKLNAKVMEEEFRRRDIPMVSNGTDNHLLLLDLSKFYRSGREYATFLENTGVICNCNAIPNDPKGFFKTSGIRLGTPNITARGFNEEDTRMLAQDIAEVVLYPVLYKGLEQRVKYLTNKYPLKNIYPHKYKRLFEDEV